LTDETSHRRKHIGLTLLKWVSAILLVGLFVLLAAYLIAVALGGQGGDKAMPPAPVTTELITRGAYLARAGDCSACHTAPGAQAFAGGLAM
jgi:mono/diheme cytochrome c family protein